MTGKVRPNSQKKEGLGENDLALTWAGSFDDLVRIRTSAGAADLFCLVHLLWLWKPSANEALVAMGVATYFAVICMGEGTGEALVD